MKERIKRHLLTVIFLAFVLSSCEFYRKHEGVKQLQWAQNDIKTYEVDISNTKQKYDVYIALRHVPGISHDDFKVKMMVKNPSNEGTQKSYVLPIRNKETGKLYGEAAHEICDTETVVQKAFQFPQKGKYTFQIQQDVSASPALGVMEVGLVIKETGK